MSAEQAVTAHQNASGHMVDTVTTITVNPGRVSVVVAPVPGLRYWSAPKPAQLRKWVDDALKGTGQKRDGARIEHRGSIGKWYFSYYTTAA